MVGTALVFFVIQGPAFSADNFKSDQKELNHEAHKEKYWALVGFILCVLGFMAYLRDQVNKAHLDADSSIAKELEAKVTKARVKAIGEGVMEVGARVDAAPARSAARAMTSSSPTASSRR